MLFSSVQFSLNGFIVFPNIIYTHKGIVVVSCSLIVPRLGGVGFGFGLMGKLGGAWHRCMGAWVVHGVVTGVLGMQK